MAQLWPLFNRSAWAQPAIVVAGMKFEGAAMDSVLFVGVVSASHCGGGHDRWGRCSGLCLLGRRGFSQPLWWRAWQLRTLPWPLFARSAWDHPATVVDGHDIWGRRYCICSLDRSGLSQPLWWRARPVRALLWPSFARSAWAQPATAVRTRQVRALLWPLFARSSWAQATTAVAGTTGKGAALVYWIIRRGLSQPLWWRAQLIRALLWPLIALSAWSQPATVVAGTTFEGADPAPVHLVSVGPANYCSGWHDMW
jgi:hypothetical protein